MTLKSWLPTADEPKLKEEEDWNEGLVEEDGG